jgi:signal transduction histidine kinase
VGLRERAEHVGGRLSAGAAADRGWVLRIEVPA